MYTAVASEAIQIKKPTLDCCVTQGLLVAVAVLAVFRLLVVAAVVVINQSLLRLKIMP
jgi:hypothetical protein